MNIRNFGLKLTLFASLISSSAFSNSVFEEFAPISFANFIHMSRSKDPIDGGWLPNLKGLPTNDEIKLYTRQIKDLLKNFEDKECEAIDFNLKMVMFQHFLIHQKMANNVNVYFDDTTSATWGKILAMILKESSGDSASVTDMSGASISTYRPKTDLEHWRNILDLSIKSRIKLNYQTNFGLAQTSADRLFDAFHLAKNQYNNTQYLQGLDGASTLHKTPLNTAIAIRRLIWFYQDFAQGRVKQSDKRIREQDITLPEYAARHKEGIQMALLYCGTRFLFKETDENILEEAMASIAYCRLGNAHDGYGKNEADEHCFAQWVTLCPTLNMDIAHLIPLSYFATRKATPVCVDSFKQLVNPKPEDH